MLRHSVGRASARGSRDLRAGVPRRPRLAERGLSAHEHADGSRGRAGRVLGLRPRQLAADAALPEGVARALRGRRPARDRRAHAGLLVRARPRHGGPSGGAARDRLPGAARPRLPDMAGVRQPRLAGPLPVRPHRQVGAHPLRRGRVRGHRARHRRGPRARRGADETGPPGGRAGHAPRAADRRHQAARRARQARARARLDRRRGLDRRRRRGRRGQFRVQRRRRLRGPVRRRQGARALRGGWNRRGGVPGTPPHGVQFTPKAP